MTKGEIKRLGERLDRISESNNGVQLTSEQHFLVQDFWLRLHFTPEEWAEWLNLQERHDALYARYAGSPEDIEEWNEIGSRMVELGHDLALQRSVHNRPLRAKVWPELARHVLRFHELTGKPSEELTSDETKELETILEWFNELQGEALGET